MFLELDGQGAAYEQIIRAIRQAITDGRFPQGMRLPPSRDLAQQLHVSRNTVTAAYERLLADGWLTARVGSGTFISAPVLPQARPQSAKPSPVRLSRFAERLLQEVVIEDLPGRVIPAVRHMFQYKAPYADPTLLSAWSRSLRKAANYTALRYARCQGIEPLRVQISEFLGRRRGVVAPPEDIIVVNGSQQAFSLCARILFDPGDRVMIEEPSFYPMRVSFQSYGAELLPSPVDGNGITLGGLSKKPKLIALTPAHQFPLGHRLSFERRKELLEYAHANDAWIIEDDYDGEYRYDAKYAPTLRSRDSQGRVIYVGSFSKTFFPAVRLGYVVVPPPLRDAFIASKFLEDMGAPVVVQAAMAFLLEDGSFDRHLVKSVKQLRVRRDALTAGLLKINPEFRISGAHAGMHLVVCLPGWTAGFVEELKRVALQKGLAIYSTVPYYLGAASQPGLLLGYASSSTSEIGWGLRVLRDVIAEVNEGQ